MAQRNKRKDIEKDYEIDLYVDGERIEYFPPDGWDRSDRIQHVKDWAKREGLTDYQVVVKTIPYWYIGKFDPTTNRIIDQRKIYLVQISTIAEIEKRFANGRIA